MKRFTYLVEVHFRQRLLHILDSAKLNPNTQCEKIGIFSTFQIVVPTKHTADALHKFAEFKVSGFNLKAKSEMKFKRTLAGSIYRRGIQHTLFTSARPRGASKIISVDVNPEKFETGIWKKFGLTDFINPNDCGGRPVSEVIKEMTEGGADYCFECIGLAFLMNDAFSSCKPGWGKTVILGVEMHGAPLSINPREMLKGKSIMGSLFRGIKAKTDIPILVKSYLDMELHLDSFITHEIGFHDIKKASIFFFKGLVYVV